MWKLIILIHGATSHGGFGGPVILDVYQDVESCRAVAEAVVDQSTMVPSSWARPDATVTAAYCIDSKTGETVGFE